MSVKASGRNFLEGFGQLAFSPASLDDGKEPNIVCHSGWESEEFWTKRVQRNCEQNFGVPDDFFEGAEKLLEVCWVPGSGGDLQRLTRDMIEEILQLARCEIISTTSNSSVTAYLLSESSLFVDKNRAMLKTCGTTSPLDCLPKLLELASETCNLTEVQRIVYSRRNFMEPGQQPGPHRSWEEEASSLRSVFTAGSAFTMGSIYGDCWHFFRLHQGCKSTPDQKLELMMTELDQEKMRIFDQRFSTDGLDCRQKSGIHKLLPEMKMDDFLFSPIGYSMNGIMKESSEEHKGPSFMTIHVTPQPSCSYASFETNSSSASVGLICQVLEIFNPGNFILSFYSTKVLRMLKS